MASRNLLSLAVVAVFAWLATAAVSNSQDVAATGTAPAL